jgi:NAD(P)-dependent dehydrogenase (short-subunit alcohol dehydrogenase family)
MKLAGKIAVITGGGSGIGRASAELFAREGAKVVVADYDAHGGQETATAINASGGQAIFVHVNVAEPAQVEAMVQTALATYGGIDILFNNAAVLIFGNGAVTLLTRCMAIDHAKDHIRVNAIAPGPTDTPMLRNVMTPEQRAALRP